MRYESKERSDLPIEGLCCAIASRSEGIFVLYVFHKNGTTNPSLEEINSLEDMELDLSEITDTVKARLKL